MGKNNASDYAAEQCQCGMIRFYANEATRTAQKSAQQAVVGGVVIIVHATPTTGPTSSSFKGPHLHGS